MKAIPLVLTLLAAAAPAVAGEVEWGRVDWLRDYEEGASRSKAAGKPLFVLFQEVPG